MTVFGEERKYYTGTGYRIHLKQLIFSIDADKTGQEELSVQKLSSAQSINKFSNGHSMLCDHCIACKQNESFKFEFSTINHSQSTT